jgi:heterotetrameric sarcosine oxidase delta subunit
MRISCPFCGPRDLGEFTYFGDTVRRPDPLVPDAPAQFYEAVYPRDNPAGAHQEYWYHANGCRSWLRVNRDTRTHAMLSATLASENAG